MKKWINNFLALMAPLLFIGAIGGAIGSAVNSSAYAIGHAEGNGGDGVETAEGLILRDLLPPESQNKMTIESNAIAHLKALPSFLNLLAKIAKMDGEFAYRFLRDYTQVRLIWIDGELPMLPGSYTGSFGTTANRQIAIRVKNDIYLSKPAYAQLKNKEALWIHEAFHSPLFTHEEVSMANIIIHHLAVRELVAYLVKNQDHLNWKTFLDVAQTHHYALIQSTLDTSDYPWEKGMIENLSHAERIEDPKKHAAVIHLFKNAIYKKIADQSLSDHELCTLSALQPGSEYELTFRRYDPRRPQAKGINNPFISPISYQKDILADLGTLKSYLRKSNIKCAPGNAEDIFRKMLPTITSSDKIVKMVDHFYLGILKLNKYSNGSPAPLSPFKKKERQALLRMCQNHLSKVNHSEYADTIRLYPTIHQELLTLHLNLDSKTNMNEERLISWLYLNQIRLEIDDDRSLSRIATPFKQAEFFDELIQDGRDSKSFQQHVQTAEAYCSAWRFKWNGESWH